MSLQPGSRTVAVASVIVAPFGTLTMNCETLPWLGPVSVNGPVVCVPLLNHTSSSETKYAFCVMFSCPEVMKSQSSAWSVSEACLTFTVVGVPETTALAAVALAPTSMPAIRATRPEEARTAAMDRRIRSPLRVPKMRKVIEIHPIPGGASWRHRDIDMAAYA